MAKWGIRIQEQVLQNFSPWFVVRNFGEEGNNDSRDERQMWKKLNGST
jgi:hypothetical protein